MERTACLILVYLAGVYAPHHEPHHEPDHHPGPDNHDCHPGPECDRIQEALQHIGMYFNDEICHAFEHIDCQNHVLQNDEQLCGSDGKTYSNHCLYAKARCERILDRRNYAKGILTNPIRIAYHRACGISTTSSVPITTTASIRIQSTSGSLTTGGVTAGSGTTSTPAQSLSSTPFPVSTAAPATTTAINSLVLLGGVFCQHRNEINCISTLLVVCGSDGSFYPNMCELLKAQCDYPTLREAPDANSCRLSP